MLIVSFLLLICSFVVIFQTAVKVSAAQKKEEDFYKYADIFTEVYTEINKKYVDDVDARKLFEGALQGMFLSLDNHSQFMSPDSLEQLNKDTEGEFSGIGIHITLKDNVLTVIAPIPGSPAAKLGIQSWDRIIEIEGESTEGITLVEAVKKLTGPPGTEVSITIYRKGVSEPLHFTITRANIKIDSVYHRKIGDKIGYIRLAKFSDQTAEDVKKSLLTLMKQDVEGLIIDVRFNTGGLLKEVVDISDYFVPKGKTIVSTKGRLASQNQVYKSLNDPICELPIEILVNRGSASASEILTGAIKDHNLGVVIGPKGESTFGKGSVQTIEVLENTIEWDENNNPKPCGIRLTTAKYYTPSGKTINKVGIKPDIGVDLPEGNQTELASRGLLGDPDMNEPALDMEEIGVTNDEDESTTAPENGDEGFVESFYNSELEEEEGDKKFTDVLLQESVKIMKAYLLMSRNGSRIGMLE